jgi:hypothetical protein
MLRPHVAIYTVNLEKFHRKISMPDYTQIVGRQSNTNKKALYINGLQGG